MRSERYKTNPFLHNMLIPVKGKKVRLSSLGKDDNILVNQATGEVQGTHVTTYKKVDGEKFIKLFSANIGFTFELTSPGIKVFGMLIWAIQNKAFGRDEIYLDTHTRCDFIKAQSTSSLLPKLSQATLGRGLAELVKAQIIAKTMRQGLYWINPNFVFNGDRIAFTTLIERKTKEDEVQEELKLS